ncbi:MAG TPA: phosphatase PAP2 family protein [Caulobacteraceae bacterium]|nr:phosphatase PAP2 family protein [Caulobacteraceae bacterium]
MIRPRAPHLGGSEAGLEIRLLLGCLAIAGALVGFAALAAEAREGDIGAVDRTLLLIFRVPGDLADPIGPPWVREAARDLSGLGGFTVLTLVTVFATAMLLMHRRRVQALVFAGAVVLAQGASEGLKHLIDRPRPILVPHLDLVYSSSFPSGHALMSPVVYLTLAAVVAAGAESRRVKAWLLGSAILLVIAIGVTRVFLGVHWPTDVLAGWALGSAIALVASYALLRAAPPAMGGQA